jgi:3-oxoacyl-[acyl-carrier protein] reductase
MNQFLSKEERDSLIEEIPANRFGRTEEVADLVYQLATGNEYLNGQVIHLDGAWI